MTGNNLRCWVVLSAGLLLCAGHGAAWAQAAADKAAADTLFNEGKQLIRKGEDAAACEKFEASLSKLTQLGTQLALASCYERVGRTASAWGGFRAAASAASRAHDKRQRFAEDRATALEARLSKIVITIDPSNRVDGLAVKRDGSRVAPAELDSPVPVDPGEHTVEASAPGRVAWSIKVSVSSTPGTVDVSVPALEKVPAPRAARRPHRTLAYGLGGGGLALIGVSLIFGELARSRWNDAQPHCYADHRCDPTGIDLAGSAGTLGNVSTATFAVGAGAVAAAAILLVIAPPVGAEKVQPANPMALHLVPDVGPAQIGLTIRGGF